MVSNDAILIIALSLAVIAVSITVHEFIHGYVSYLLGDDTAKLSGRLSLNPLQHIDPFATVLLPIVLVLVGLPPFGAAKPVPFNPYKLKYNEFGTAIVALSGPLSNLLMASVGGFILRSVGTLDSTIWTTWWWLFIAINVGFFVFNMIPLPPLDGSRVLYAFAPEAMQKAMMQIERFGFLTVVIFMFFLFPLLSPVLQSINQNLVGFVIGA